MAEDKDITRQNFTDVTAEDKERKVGALKACRDFALKSFLPVSDNCHFERYNFNCGKEKLSVVYDTKAQLLTLTAIGKVVDRCVEVMNTQPTNQNQPVKRSSSPSPQKQPDSKKQPPQKQQPDGKIQSQQKQQPDNIKQAQQKQQPDNKKQSPQKPWESNIRKAEGSKSQQKKQSDGKLQQKKQSDDKKQAQQKQQQGNKKQTQVQASKKSELKKLKKLVPNAYDLLGEQSRTDLGIGMTDIGNENVRLSDYSVLLVPPYRGLERFIYDLQTKVGISVKMIGQAYEKEESGKHVLKQCYRKRTGIVYSEVMSALYCEYFAKRNFYAHSDNTEQGSNRIIDDKDAAKKIFAELCEIIDYNAKKLKETNFKEKYYG